MPEISVSPNLLVAGSIETCSTIEHALREHQPRMHVLRVDDVQSLRHALETSRWHVVFSELELLDFSAIELVNMFEEQGMDVPVMVIEETGDEDIALRCLESGLCRFMRLAPPYLKILPRLVEGLLRRTGMEQAHRLSERMLKESEERYLDVINHTSDLIQCVALDGSFVYTNRAWREAMGYSEEEVGSLNLLDVLHPDSMACCQDRFQRLLGGETLSCIEFKFLAKTGVPVYLAGDCGSIIKEGKVISTRGIFKNITDTIQARQALRNTEARYQALYDNAPDIYATLSASGEILSMNHNGARMLGYEIDELVGESVALVVHPEDQRAVFECIDSLFHRAASWVDIEFRAMRKDGSVFWVQQRAGLEPGAASPKLLVVCRDITEKRNLEDALAYQASHDSLTNLINRREFEWRFQQVMERSRDPDDRHVLCFLDLDQFKIINDTCGHMAGDELLRQVATLLAGLMRTRDTLARIGGDEFVVLMEHASLDRALQLAEKIRAAIEAFEFHWRSERFSIGVSIGVVPTQIGQSITDTLNLADTACYTAKKEGRNCVYTMSSEGSV